MVSSTSTAATALRLGRAWRNAAARRRRRAGLSSFGSSVSIVGAGASLSEEGIFVIGGSGGGGRSGSSGFTTATASVAAASASASAASAASAASPASAADELDDLSAVRGAASWAIELLLAPGSAEVRSEASSLVRHLAADGERQRYAVLARLAAALPAACAAAAAASPLSTLSTAATDVSAVAAVAASVAAVAAVAATAGAAIADDYFDLLSAMLCDDAVARRFLVCRGGVVPG